MENKEEEIIIETQTPKKEKKVNAQKTKKPCFLTLSNLPTFLYIVSIGLTLIAHFFGLCTAYTTQKIFYCLSILTIIGAVVLDSIEIFKSKDFHLKPQYAVSAFAILVLCI